MTEDEARETIAATVSRETLASLEAYVALLEAHAAEQNLIASSTLEQVWCRHILDSSQLLALAPMEGPWADMGSGAGLPGLVIAALSERRVRLIEPRSKRVTFLMEAVERMGLGDRVEVVRSRVETAPAEDAAVISARAVASLGDLFAMGARHATNDTIWVLPKGRSAVSEVALAETSWHAQIRLVPSITDSDASIIVASGVRRKRP